MAVDLNTKLSVISAANSQHGIPTDHSLKEIIANSSGGGDATKYLNGTGALSTPAGGGGGSGLVLIDSGKITAPVAFLDVTLPSGYLAFKLFFSGFSISATDEFTAAFSSDGGATFYNDNTNYDTYTVANHGYSGSGSFVLNQNYDRFDALIFLSASVSSPQVTDAELVILPGSASIPPRLFGVVSSFLHPSGTGVGQYLNVWASLSPDAMVPPVLARVDLIHFQPWGNGDVNPPTSSETITAGSWVLFGVPAP
jgi:hypothetical protein